ncbi:MAG: right-handed parallel beta-helix repeat-containing protein [Bacteroidales bacterium]|nr:right-handed parallel beta-helix repeat-containing protein [Bacteroidales bacterium]
MKLITIYSLFLILIINSLFSQSKNKGCTLPELINGGGEYRLLKSCSPYLAPKKILVEAGTLLTAEPGVVIEFPDSGLLYVEGSIKFIGTSDEPITLKKTTSANRWLHIYVYKSKDSAIFENIIFEDALRAVWTHNTKLRINKVTANRMINFVKVKYGAAKIFDNSFISLDNIGTEISDIIEGISAAMIIRNNHITCPLKGRKTDAIDVGNYSNIIIEGNTIIGSLNVNNADCIDADGCPNITIRNNVVHNNKDKGLSIGGKNSTGIIIGNIIYNSKIGIAVKDTAKVDVINNTFYSNDTSLYFRSLANSKVINNLIVASDKTNYYNYNSNVTLSYNLCDNEIFSGIGNIKGDPKLVAPASQDFNLQSKSPCIDAGDPDRPLDPDKTRSDIGALYYNQANSVRNLFINEVLVLNKTKIQDEAGDYDSWIEIYNKNDVEIDLAGLYLTNDLNLPQKFRFPANNPQTKIPAFGYKLIWCDNESTEGALHTNFNLNLNKFNLGLYNQIENELFVIDTLSAGKQSQDIAFCRYPDGFSYKDYTLLPTPGSSNILIITVNELKNANSKDLNIHRLPDGSLYIYINLESAQKANIKVFDLRGRCLFDMNNLYLKTGFNEIKIDEAAAPIFSQGTYLLRIISSSYNISKKFIVY